MPLTVNNLNTLSLLNILNKTGSAQSDVLSRLSTGQRVNKGSDDPAGLIALSSIGSSLTSVNAGIASNQRTDALLGVADGALGEVTKLLTNIQKLADESVNDAGLTASEKAANQAQIDDAITSIDRIVNSANFNGKKLLDGSLSIQTSGAANSAITDIKVFSRSTSLSTTALNVNVVSAATQAAVTSVATTSASSATSISIQGKTGTAIIEVASTENLSSVVAKINNAKNQTGVSASLSGAVINANSTDFGTAAFVRVSVLSGDTTNFSNKYDAGSDANVTVNGQKAAVDGKTINFSSGGISAKFEITNGYNQAGGAKTFYVKNNGGATFQLGTESNTRSTVGLDGIFASQLGTKDLGYLSSLKSGGANALVNDPFNASKIARQANSQIATLQGRLGSFQKLQVQTSINSLTAQKEGLEKAKSVIGDVDYATETAELNRQNVLLQSAISLLGLANQQSSQVLSLLR